MNVICDVNEVEPTNKKIVNRMKEMVIKLKKHNVIFTEKGAEDPL